MSDQRPDDEVLGRALARAIDAQTVRQTAFSQSQVARRLDGPASRGWLSTLAVAAALGLFVAMGAFFISRGPFGAANPGSSPSPDASPAPTATASPAPTASATAPAAATATAAPTPTASATAPAAEAALVYFARDLLPPVGGTVPAAAPFRTLSAAERISARVRALWDARPPSAPAGLVNVFRPHTGGASLANVTTSISGDTATVVIDAGTWDSLSSAEGIALTQQLVYTITEEPGIRRAAVREPGKDHAVIGNGIFRDARSREDVHGYVAQPLSERITSTADVVPMRGTVTHSVDAVAPGLARVVIALTGVSGQLPLRTHPASIRAEVRLNDDVARPGYGKYSLVLQIDGVEGTASTTTVDRTPLRAIRFTPGTNAQRTATYELALDDLRPWRVAFLTLTDPPRVVVDIGGHPSATVANTVVYSPRPGATVDRDFSVSGMARAFEATVSWRLRDSAGREVARGFTTASEGSSAVWGTYDFRVQVPANVSGNVTLDVYQASARDGSDTFKVEVRLQVR